MFSARFRYRTAARRAGRLDWLSIILIGSISRDLPGMTARSKAIKLAI